jgi:hypothetical protein
LQEVSRVTFLQRVFDIDAQTWRAVRHIKGRSADDPADHSVNSNFAVDLVLDVSSGEGWSQFEFHCLGKIPNPIGYAMPFLKKKRFINTCVITTYVWPGPGLAQVGIKKTPPRGGVFA